MISFDAIGRFFFIELTTLGRIHHHDKSLQSIPAVKNRRRVELYNTKLITGICTDLVPRTARYPDKARVDVRRRERDKGRQTPSTSRQRGSIQPMVARKTRESGERGSIRKAETSNLGEKMR